MYENKLVSPILSKFYSADFAGLKHSQFRKA